MGQNWLKTTKLRPLTSKTWLCAEYTEHDNTLAMPARIEAEDEEEAALIYTKTCLAYEYNLGRVWVGVRIPRSSVWLLGTCFIEDWDDDDEPECTFEAFEKAMVEEKS